MNILYTSLLHLHVFHYMLYKCHHHILTSRSVYIRHDFFYIPYLTAALFCIYIIAISCVCSAKKKKTDIIPMYHYMDSK